MRRHFARLLVLALALPLGCAAQYEEPTGAQPDSARDQAGSPEPSPTGDMDTAAAERAEAERSLGDIERELASNEAKLRALGVELPSRAVTGGEANFADEPAPEQEPALPGGGTTTPDSRPSTAPAPKSEPTGSGKAGSSPKPGRKDSKDKPGKKKTEDADPSDRFANPPPGAEPEEAKATPLSPTEQPQLDAATRCIQVCELSEITCELGVQICELAQRHAGDRDYEQACARATEDCDAAQEACDVCAG